MAVVQFASNALSLNRWIDVGNSTWKLFAVLSKRCYAEHRGLVEVEIYLIAGIVFARSINCDETEINANANANLCVMLYT